MKFPPMLTFLSISSLLLVNANDGTCKNLSIKIQTDWWPSESLWEIKDSETKRVIYRNGPFQQIFSRYENAGCIDPTACLTFHMLDSYGDGIVNGLYEVEYDGNVIAEGGSQRAGGAFFEEVSGPFGHCSVTTPSVSPAPSTQFPTNLPSTTPTVKPTDTPSFTLKPSTAPTLQPSATPSLIPTAQPSDVTSTPPTLQPSNTPSTVPSLPPVLGIATNTPTKSPSKSPTISINEPSPFEITLFRVGDNSDYDEAFRLAKNRWEEIIKGDLTNQIPNTNNPNFDWFGGTWEEQGVRNNDPIEDLLIGYEITDIDGIGGTLGFAGPKFARFNEPGKITTISGIMKFDIQDFETRSQTDAYLIILHEMGHVLGLGSYLNFQCGTNCENGDDSYTCPTASKEYRDIFGSNTSIELDLDSCGHWSEGAFQNRAKSELMTPFFESGKYQPLSRVSIGALADLGYDVDLNAADPWNGSTQPLRIASLPPPIPQSNFILSENNIHHISMMNDYEYNAEDHRVGCEDDIGPDGCFLIPYVQADLYSNTYQFFKPIEILDISLWEGGNLISPKSDAMGQFLFGDDWSWGNTYDAKCTSNEKDSVACNITGGYFLTLECPEENYGGECKVCKV